MTYKDYVEDADLGDENDAEYLDQLFQMWSLQGWTPGVVQDKVLAEKFQKWLQSSAGTLDK
jgi:hypothetical protein